MKCSFHCISPESLEVKFQAVCWIELKMSTKYGKRAVPWHTCRISFTPISMWNDLLRWTCTYGPLCGRTSVGILFVLQSWRPIGCFHPQQPHLDRHHQMLSCILNVKQLKATKHFLGKIPRRNLSVPTFVEFCCQYCFDGNGFSLYLLRLCPQMSSASRDFHFEYLLLWDKVRCRPSTDKNMNVFLLISLSWSQFHISPEGSTSTPSHSWVFRVLLCVASKHFNEPTHISMPSSIQIHCWKSDFRSHFFSQTSSVALEPCRHRLCWVL